MHSSCPACDTPLRRGARSCSCGWMAQGVSKQSPLGYSQCDWEADGLRCRYPGSMSTNLACTGPWYCQPHYSCRDPLFGAQIVQASMDYKHPTEDEIVAETRRRQHAYCASIGMLRKDGESPESYAVRRKNWLRERFTKVFKEAA